MMRCPRRIKILSTDSNLQYRIKTGIFPHFLDLSILLVYLYINHRTRMSADAMWSAGMYVTTGCSIKTPIALTYQLVGQNLSGFPVAEAHDHLADQS